MLSFKRLIFYVMLLIGCFNSLSQEYTITGIVKDSAQVIAYANVILTDIDGKIITGTITEENGSFNLTIQQGEYILTVSFLGYQTWKQPISTGQKLDLGVVVLNPKNNELDEVVVTGSKRLIEKKVDRLIFNLSESAVSSGLNGIEAISMAPLVDVQNEDELKIIGKSHLSLMIDGKLLPLKGEEIVSYLKTLRSDNIQKIEIITAPPAKYDATGNSGILNVILKKNIETGFSGIISDTYSLRKYSSNNINSTINYKYKNIGVTSRISYLFDQAIPYETFNILDINNNHLLYQDNNRFDKKRNFALSLNSNYKISSKSDLWITYDYRPRKTKYDIQSFSRYPQEDSLLLTKITRERNIYSHIGTINYELNVINGKKLNLSFNYLDNDKSEPNLYEIQNNEEYNYTTANNEVSYKIWSGQTDFEFPLSELNFETGAKYTNISNELEQDYYSNYSDLASTGFFKYEEEIFALYVSSQKKINEKLEIKAGLRYENSVAHLYLENKTQKEINTLFPSIYFNYSVKDNGIFSFNYTKRINRPDFQSLSPYTLYTNSNTYSVGNPFLNPSINHNIEFSYSKRNLTLNAYWEYEKNGFGNVFGFDDDGNNYTSIDNFFNQQNWGIYGVYYKSLYPWWQSQVTTQLYYQRAESTNSQFIGKQGASFYYNIQNVFFLNTNKSLKLTLSFWHKLPRNNTNIHWKGSSNLSTRINYAAIKETLQFSLGVYDILRTNRSAGQFYNESYTRHFKNYYDFRKLTVGVTYNFGNKKIKSSKSKARFEENQRAN